MLVGSDWTRAAEIYREADASPFREEIVFPGFVPTIDIPDLYRGADLFTFPSSYEGFGLPVLEAMACGTPVACANVASLPEVGGEAARYFDPDDEDDIAEVVEELLTDRGQHDTCIRLGTEHARRFTWRGTAEKTLEVLRHAARAH